ncbi:kelch-like protein 24 [Ylistrum balloti]|uniref:kelch-like protein 24 n=1 Tax=Ylistrum balloti TaxID=509963 RepID=UPI002905E164|nr:kelch-like protein 24 [Ylistrum balloti]
MMADVDASSNHSQDKNDDEDDHEPEDDGPYLGRDLHEGIQALYHEKSLTDVTIVVDSEKFPCHRLVLASLSPFFRSMFTSEFKEKSQDEVELKCVNAATFKCILDYIYAFDEVIDNDNVQELLKSACMLGIGSLQYDCENFIIDKLTFEDCASTLKFAKAHSCKKLADSCLEKLGEKFDKFSASEDFLDLDKEDVIEMMKMEILTTSAEENTVEAVMKWVTYKSEERQVGAVLYDVLEYVKFPLMQAEYLFELTECYPILCENSHVRSLLDEAKLYHCNGVRRHEISSHRTHYRKKSKLTNIMFSVKCDNTPSLYAYSFQEENWGFQRFTSPTAYGLGTASCIYGNDLYVHGGVANSRGQLQKFISQTNNWVKCPSSGKRMYNHALVCVRQCLYAIGGCEVEHNRVMSGIMEFDVTSESWAPVTKAALPCAVHTFSATAIDRKVYIFGGKTREDSASLKIQCFDTVSRQTTVFGDLPVPVALSGAITVDKTVYLASGAGEIIQWTPRDGGLIIKSVLKKERSKERGTQLVYHNKKLVVFSAFDYEDYELLPISENCLVDLESGNIEHPWMNFPELSTWGRADRCRMHLCIAPRSYFMSHLDDPNPDDESNDENGDEDQS